MSSVASVTSTVQCMFHLLSELVTYNSATQTRRLARYAPRSSLYGTVQPAQLSSLRDDDSLPPAAVVVTFKTVLNMIALRKGKTG